ncbi:ATP-binding protein [uncultured Polaribacter sp.]|uniref:ATP-binding protein n=1 Tax=uncultured Polaribacter sp. TaxID=174711 RepID=UPI00260788DB|nr:ATP-binding protein [uncultured Polaribacter sp.]
MVEDKNKDYKSIRKVIGKQADLKSLAETCVCFANAQGGEIIIGIEDKESEPPKNQTIEVEQVNNVIKRLRDLTDGVGIVNQNIVTHSNGGEYFSIRILPSTRTIATTSTGKVFIRVSDNCFPVSSEELTNLASEKTAFQWEIIVVQKIKLEQADPTKVSSFLEDIQLSDKVSDFIKAKENFEILEFYQLISPEGFLTNMGVLWLGTPAQRARLSYPLTIQYIVYNDKEEKIRKKDWHFHLHNPKELLLEIEKEAVELTYSTELPDGLFRKNIRQYPKEVIREILINAIAHKKYTVSGDIFIEVYPNRLVITNPGNLPLGITNQNILHERHRRNPHLIQILSDLKLMEGEGSGYDLVFEKLARDAKPLPKVENDFSKVAVTIFSGTINPEAVSILDYIDKHFNLSQKEFIALGVIATEKKILTTHLASKLQLNQEDKMRTWVTGLVNNNIIITQGIKKGTEYLLNPELFAQAKLDIIPSLKTLEPYKLEALIIEDLKYNGESKLSDIKSRIPEALEKDIQKAVYKLVKENRLNPLGGNRNRTYKLSKKK